MRNAHLLRRVVIWSLVAASGLTPSPATASGGAGSWGKVTALKPDTHMFVKFVRLPELPPGPGTDNREIVEGWFVSAGPDDVVLYVGGRIVTIPRERVLKVAVLKEGRPWYAIPLVVAAAAGGVVLSIGTLLALASAGDLAATDDSEYGWLAIFAAPVVLGVWAYRKTDGLKQTVKVIYEAQSAYPANKLFSTNSTLAGRSASRRMYQGNQNSP